MSCLVDGQTSTTTRTTSTSAAFAAMTSSTTTTATAAARAAATVDEDKEKHKENAPSNGGNHDEDRLCDESRLAEGFIKWHHVFWRIQLAEKILSKSASNLLINKDGVIVRAFETCSFVRTFGNIIVVFTLRMIQVVVLNSTRVYVIFEQLKAVIFITQNLRINIY